MEPNHMTTQVFAFPSIRGTSAVSLAVRTVTKEGNTWFVAKDIADVLGYREAKDMTRNLDDDEKGAHIVPTLGGEQEALIISESGLFAAILKSRRKEAKEFRKWVTSVVLPSIRQHGGYAKGQEDLPEALVTNLHRTIRENAMPALRYYDRLTEHDHWKSKGRSQASSEWATQEAALKFDLPLSLMTVTRPE
jgi:prophage antirepressor-like protein